MIVSENCYNCVWYETDQCDRDTESFEYEPECSYCPVIEMVSNEDIILLIEEGRKEYYDAYQYYICEYNSF